MKLLFILLLVGVVMGATYEIAEPDLLEEIERSSDNVIAYLQERREEIKERLENFRGEELTPAKERRVRYVDPTYCLEENVYYQEKGEWKVLYPKGYCFNPVEYIPYDPPAIVVFNPCRKEEREWVREYLKKDSSVLLVASGCSLKEVSRQGWKVPVYYLLPDLKEKLSLEHTISLISVDRKRKAIKVEEVDATSGSKGGASGEGEEGS